MNNFLLELLSEEIPSSDQAYGRQFLENYFKQKLNIVKLPYSEMSTYSSPTRLVLHIERIAEQAPSIIKEKRGPREHCDQKALEGFLASNKVNRTDLIIKEVNGKNYYFLSKEEEGKRSQEFLSQTLNSVLHEFKWKKSMRWGTSKFKWIRPLKSILAIEYSSSKGKHIVKARAENILSSDKTLGHKFASPKIFSVVGFDDYTNKLASNFVEFNHKQREKKIIGQLDELVENQKLEVVRDEELLAEVTGLVDWPIALMGTIDKQFLDLPPEILKTVMRTQQKYFSVIDKDSKKITKYITVSNIESLDRGKQILAGNNRVLNSRLSDAKFFWALDRARIENHGFESFAKDLKAVTFFRGLGSQALRVKRLKKVAYAINKNIFVLPDQEIELASSVCKADLVSSTVKEFPELQGLLGHYFSKYSGLPEAVGLACREHYAPLGPSDKVPTSPLSVIISLADKIDLLSSFWSINEKPTGSKDPFGLRRAALGIFRIIVENKIDIKLSELFQFSDLKFDRESIMLFFIDRMRVYLKDIGIESVAFDACAKSLEDFGIFSFVNRVTVLASFLGSSEGQRLLNLSKRALSILVSEEKKDGVEYSLRPKKHENLCLEELELILALEKADKKLSQKLILNSYSDSLLELSNLHVNVEKFFTNIQINCDNNILRRNRLCTLGFLRELLDRVADFKILE